jgi:hypothetical protein
LRDPVDPNLVTLFDILKSWQNSVHHQGGGGVHVAEPVKKNTNNINYN